MKDFRFHLALFTALLIHGVLLFLLEGRQWRETLPVEKKFLPVELIQPKKNQENPPEIEPRILAQIDQMAPDQLISMPRSRPRPVTLPQPGRSDDGGKEKSRIQPRDSDRYEANNKKGRRKAERMEFDSLPRPVPPAKRRNDRNRKDLSRPMHLMPTLAQIKQWDQDNHPRDGKFRNREKTLELNTRKVRYAVYFSRLKERIEQGWIYPERAKALHLSGKLRLKFSLDRQGRLLALKILRSTGEPILDAAALHAVKQAAPFAPLPESWNLDKIHVTTTFEYIRKKIIWSQD